MMRLCGVRRGILVLALGGGLITAFGARAQSLRDAMVSAYLMNPQLRADHARQRALDEDVSRAASGWKPQVTVSGQKGYGRDRLGYGYLNPPETVKESIQPEAYILQLNQPIYDGGKTAALTGKANFLVQGGLAHGEGVEETVLGDAVQSYYDLYRDQIILGLAKQTARALEEELKSLQARFAAKDVTVADLTQAESRLARGIAQRIAAEAQVGVSRSGFIRSTGLTPGKLRPLPPLPTSLIPATQEEVLTQVLRNNPAVREAEKAVKAAREDVDAAESGLKPILSLQLSDQYLSDTSQGHFKTQYTEALLNLQIPLYTGGADYASVREAKNVVAQRVGEVDDARQQAIDKAKRSLEQLKAAQERMNILKQQVNYADLALTAVKAELRVGAREVIDELNAEQELLDAKISLAQAQHDEAIQTYDVLTSMGRLTARDMKLPVPLYDPKKYYEAESGRWFGTDIPVEVPESGEGDLKGLPH